MLRFPSATATRPARRRRSLRDVLAARRVRAASARRGLAHRSAPTRVAAQAQTRVRATRARDVYDVAVSRGIAPPF